ncbi:MAG: SRPBCC domain-containing protein [Cyclobacteriaceae bacterium]|nr:SRPBCC domain-containing protein [Cyclobacteriaceae bacterium]
MKTRTLRQTASFTATPKEVYDLLMDSRKHGKLVGGKVTMSRKAGGKFNVFDGYCHGYNIQLVEGKKIVQAWHFAEDGWPEDHFSTCTFTFQKSATGTRLTFVQQGIPDHLVESLKGGWKQYYWEPMKLQLSRK